MIKQFDLKLDHGRGETSFVDHIAIGDLQSTIIDLLNRNTCFGGEITPSNPNDYFYQWGKN